MSINEPFGRRLRQIGQSYRHERQNRRRRRVATNPRGQAPGGGHQSTHNSREHGDAASGTY